MNIGQLIIISIATILAIFATISLYQKQKHKVSV